MRWKHACAVVMMLAGATAFAQLLLPWTLCLLVAAADGTGAAPTEGDNFPHPVIGWEIPPDVDIVGLPAGVNPIKRFDDYSWKTFVAITWPSVSDKRDVPD